MTRHPRLPSLTLRAILTIGFVLVGYILLSDHFAAFDAWIAGSVLDVLGFDVSSPEPGRLTVEAGSTFDVYAIVTGACSSAAGVLGIAAVSLCLLPGSRRRRLAGCLLAAALFVACNIARICSILLLGTYVAEVPTWMSLTTFAVPAVVCAALVLGPRTGAALRASAALAGAMLGIFAWRVGAGGDYTHTMVAYHALAGPLLTFIALAGALLLLWRVLVGAESTRAASA
jgi:hypothetical protein